MKFLLICLGVFLVAWRWRVYRETHKLKQKTAAPPPKTTVEMAPCAHCGLHVPVADAISGAQGVYCKAEHQRAAEG
jgi:uncharacterized protein